MPAPLPKMTTKWDPKAVKSTFGYTGGAGVPDVPSANRVGDKFVGIGIDSAEQTESLDADFQTMYGNLHRTLRGTK